MDFIAVKCRTRQARQDAVHLPDGAMYLRGCLIRTEGSMGRQQQTFDAEAYKQQQYDLLADAVRKALDMDMIYRILNREV